MRYDTVGGRRFILAIGSGVTATILQWCGKLDPAGSSYALIVIGTVAAYITGNVLEGKKNADTTS
jgi:hypothetical protein